MTKLFTTTALLATAAAALVLIGTADGAMARTNSIAIAAAAAAGQNHTAGGASFNSTTAARATAFIAAQAAAPRGVVTKNGVTTVYGSSGYNNLITNKPIVYVVPPTKPVRDSSGHVIARTNDRALGQAPKHVICNANFCHVVQANG